MIGKGVGGWREERERGKRRERDGQKFGGQKLDRGGRGKIFNQK